MAKIGTDKAKAFPSALQSLTGDNVFSKKHIHYAIKKLQQGIESDHSRLKRPISQSGKI
ncbi:DDE-type integrase/transposase/recombinase [Bartonella sp. HY038]|uniref:DDE-type integrase/transposase/recombinase n=1 Tax=Bartonella sp. HY038 TaxID=2759660 RepID=UPI0015FD056C|nr:DDE-type integrase/transposase/recombinase [Bartonella sp. HY038]